MKTEERMITNREVKSSAFTAFFSDPRNAAQLYEALDKTEPVSPEDIFYWTLEGVLFMARKNDMAFTVKDKILVISEHQSTINRNMPLRNAIYFGRTIEKIVEPRSLYRSKLIQFPTPEFYVFYNGEQPYPGEKILKLSDSYLDKTVNPMLELKVKVININLPADHPILDQCRPLYEYSWFIQRIRDYQGTGMNRDASITRAIKDCEQEGVLTEFLREHGTEAVNMLFTEFNMEDALEVRYEEGKEDGIEEGKVKGKAEGKAEAILELLEELGTVSEELRRTILAEHDLIQLKEWLKLAVKSSSVDEFQKKMQVFDF